MRRKLIQAVLPLVFCTMPPLAGALIALALPTRARDFYLTHLTALDLLILILGCRSVSAANAVGVAGAAPAPQQLRRTARSVADASAQAAEWFPLLGLLGTVAGILQTFSSMGGGSTTPQQIITLYAPAITATGSGLFMALVNILPTWLVLVGRDLIRTLGGDAPGEPTATREKAMK